MSHFSTELIVPDKQEMASGFFRVIGPVLTWVIFAGFIKSYYQANGYAPPFFLANGLLTFITILITVFSLLMWYHKRYDKRGTLNVHADHLEFTWDDSERKYNLPLKDLKDLTLVYDGYAGFSSPFKGTNNYFSFVHAGEKYNLHFFLGSQNDTLALAEVLKKWYENNVNFKEYNSKGQERYLMLYNAAYKSVIA